MELCLILTMPVLITVANALTMEIRAAHKSNATLYCNYPQFQMPVTPWQIYWILPNETVIQPRFAGDEKFRVGIPPAYNLTVINIDYHDFGWFYCVILWDNYHYLVDSVKVGLNTNGGIYDELTDNYKEKVITGSVAAGSVFVILCLGCAIWHYRFRKEEQKAEERAAVYDFDEAIKSFDDAIEKTETDAEIENPDEITAESENAGEILLIRNKLDDAINELAANGYAVVIENAAYTSAGDEDVDSTAVKEALQNTCNNGDIIDDATPF